MVYTTYILYSLKDKRTYVGCTSDLGKRIKRHETGQVAATRFRRPLILVHKENFEDKAQAFTRERFLKSQWGSREKKKILKKFLASNLF